QSGSCYVAGCRRKPGGRCIARRVSGRGSRHFARGVTQPGRPAHSQAVASERFRAIRLER
ncbi:MAG TPA: hypothetical protein VFA49_12700, partial [Chloroflexota bacterium]|nr:hypothetical protein [Chloroflexota bacterium]